MQDPATSGPVQQNAADQQRQQSINLLVALLSADNPTRVAAEMQLHTLKQSAPDAFVTSMLETALSLLAQATSAPSPGIDEASYRQMQITTGTWRQMIVTLLRPMLIAGESSKHKESVWNCLSLQTKAQAKVYLLQFMEHEVDRKVIRKLSNTVAEIGGSLFAAGEWPDLLPFLFRCSKSTVPTQRIISLGVISELAVVLGAETFRTFLASIGEILRAALTDADNKVRLEALLSTAIFLQLMEAQEERQLFQQLLPMMLECVMSSLKLGNQMEARQAMEVFMELAEKTPTFFRPCLPQLIAAMLSIGNAQSGLEDETKRSALEVLLELCVARPTTMRKQENFLHSILSLVLSWMVEVPDNEGWYAFEEEEECNSTVGEEALDRICMSFGGKVIVPVLFPFIQNLVGNSTDWRHRWTGAKAISIAGEGCKFVLKEHLAQLIKVVQPLTNDPHARVRWAAMNCLARMLIDYAPEIQEEYGSEIVPIILGKSTDACVRVQAHCCTAISRYSETCMKSTLTPYLDSILNRLSQILLIQNKNLLEVALTALSSVAVGAREGFKQHYASFIPYLKSLMLLDGKDMASIRIKAIETITLIGVAVGKEIFAKDAVDVLQIILHTNVAPDDPNVSLLESSCSRIAECLEDHFAPYLPSVLPSVLARASALADFSYSEDEEDETSSDADDETRKTSIIEDKSEASHLLLVYASHVPTAFLPYVEQVAKIFVENMDFEYHEGVRSAAALSPPHLLGCIKENMAKLAAATGQATGNTMLVQLWQFMFPALLEAAKKEPDLEVLVEQLRSINESMTDIDGPSLTSQMVEDMADGIVFFIKEWQSRSLLRDRARRKALSDEEETAKLEEEDEEEFEILAQISENSGMLAHYHNDQYLPLFQSKVLPVVLEMMSKNRSLCERQRALCIFDDLIEFSGQKIIPLMPYFFNSLLESVSAEEPELRQAAAYGLGMCAKNLGPAFSPYASDVCNRLRMLIQHPESRETEDNIHATENAISALGKICRHQTQHINLSEVLPLWLSFLPVTEDAMEAHQCYDTLCHFIESGNPHILGANYSNLPHLVKVFVTVLDTTLVTAELSARMCKVLQWATQSASTGAPSGGTPPVSPQVLQASWGNLTPEGRAKIQQIMASYLTTQSNTTSTNTSNST
ncbi:ARM family protein [Pelomyxa schiedti]|nr:ARM family protein [Pelomyxa schiedti]